ncbi:MAG: cytochrome c [Candidatus Nitronauta litoralis]|uniref:Cytochrome c n=1 Tax=Candidatus Nitronauta litoralis TaxID=2705533 RepID=A0A7T0BV88_9BACT|nr:MAG: cytochrome c [Candidatus Nitronauta litoralis]
MIGRFFKSLNYLFAGILLFTLMGCEPDRPLAPPDYIRGHKVYYGYCSGCHESGNKKVPNLREKRFFPDKTSDSRMLKSIRDGRGKMPPQGGMLQAEDLKEVIRYIRYLQRNDQKTEKGK